MKLNSTQFSFLVALLMMSSTFFAQQAAPLDIALEHVRTNSENWGLTPLDINDMVVSDMYTDEKTGITRVYFNQTYNNIPVYNAILNLSISKKGDVFFVGKRFEQQLSNRVNTTIPVISAEDAVQKLTAHLDMPFEELRLADQEGFSSFVFEKGNLAYEDIKVSLKYQPYNGEVLLAWDVTLYPINSSDMWSTRVDAVTGQILDEHNWTVYCKVDGRSFVSADRHNCTEHAHTTLQPTTSMAAGETYNIWPIPVESPIHGSRGIVVEPHDPVASPYAWHDIDGADGAEFTITRGNNVHAYEDSGNANQSVDNEPDGGVDLIFDFPWQADWEPDQYTEAAVVNLFYMNNIMHDFAFNYGFDEVSGNFQMTNYTGMGLGTDHVNAEAQDGSGTNNANFSTPPDGNNGRMQMYRWNLGGSDFSIDEPASVAGGYEVSHPAAGDWGAGAYITMDPIVGEVVIVDDGEGDLFSDGCTDYLNAAEIEGKVALIDRGGCEFGLKGLIAQEAGAIGAIICNFDDGFVTMGAGAVGNQVNIPVVFLPKTDCQTIRQFAGNGLIARFQLPAPVVPSQADSDLDNGVIAHEYGHGISNRLTGGPGASGCLGNTEQMGEGWSDFMAIVTTVNPGDDGATPKGVGNYSDGQAFDGGGIRHFPYSTDMAINPLTYSAIPNETVPHGVGAAWCTILWDMYWAFSDQYGWSDDLYTGTGGNNMAIRLVFEGMKNQPCSPGFVDGRDAILAADLALYDGANQCLIWETFARRGVGFSARQGPGVYPGASNAVGDETEAFDLPCDCRDEITIEKTVTDFINPGDEIDVTIFVSNCKHPTATGVKVTDIIPDGTQFIPGSSSIPADVQGNIITFNLSDIPFAGDATFTYKLTSDPNKWSSLHWIDNVPDEDADLNWEIGFTGSDNNMATIWGITDAFGSYTDGFAWAALDNDGIDRFYLELIADEAAWLVTGNNPALRFYHKYNTTPGQNSGFVEVKRVADASWTKVPDRMIRNGYPGIVNYDAFVIPNLSAYSGFSGDDFEATYVDLSDWAGEEIHIRFRFGADTDNTPVQNGGWFIDDIEFQDILSYNGEACVTTAEGDNRCAIAPEGGTIVESQVVSSTEEQLENVVIATYPNPADDMLNVVIESDIVQELNLTLLTVDGKMVTSQSLMVQGKDNVQFNVSEIPAGFYFLKASSNDGTIVRKVVVQ